MKLISNLFLFFILCGIISCSRQKDMAEIKIRLPKLSSYNSMSKSSTIGLFETTTTQSPWDNTRQTSAISDINCYMVMVGGPEPELNRNQCYEYSTNSLVMSFGPIVGGVPQGQDIFVSVLAGQGRKVTLVGMNAADGYCYSFEGVGPPHGQISNPVVLAEQVVDVAPGESKFVDLVISDAKLLSGKILDKCDVDILPPPGTGGGGGGTTPLCTNDYQGADWTVANGDVVSGKHCNIGTFSVPSGVTITTTSMDKFIVEATNIVIDGTIDASGKGYSTGLGGAAGVAGSEGGGNAGPGGLAVSTTYSGDATNLLTYDYGSGGFGQPGADGGGYIELSATNTLSLNSGSYVKANGLTPGPCGGGSGAGGSIVLKANSITGTGGVEAKGGDASCSSEGAGSGGRVAFEYMSKAYSGSLVVSGGYSSLGPAAVGSAGTVLSRDLSTNVSHVDVSSWYASDRYVPISSLGVPDTLRLLSNGTMSLSGQSIASLSLEVAGGLLVLQGSSSAGNLTMSSGKIKLAGTTSVTSLNMSGGELWVDGPNVTFGDLNMTGGNATHQAHETISTLTYYLDLNVTNNFVLGAGATIDVSYKGYGSQVGPGKPTTVDTFMGGGYGGAGGGATGGPAYGSNTNPWDVGSGGDGAWGSNVTYVASGAGGGLVRINVGGTFTVDGSILAKGKYAGCCTSFGAGSGGGIYISAQTLAGTGTINADGGYGTSATSYGGGGGRIAIYYGTDTFAGAISANGGTGNSGAGAVGTIFDGGAASHPGPP